MFFLESIFLTKQASTNQLSPQPLKRINIKKKDHIEPGALKYNHLSPIIMVQWKMAAFDN